MADKGTSKERAWGMVAGIAVGAGIGAALGNLAIGIAVGVAIGAALGAARAQIPDDNDEEDRPPSDDGVNDAI